MRLKIISLVFTSLITLVVVLYLWQSVGLTFDAGIFPWVAGGYTLIVCSLQVAKDSRRLAKGHTEEGHTGVHMDIESTLDMSAWVTYKKILSNFAWIPAIYVGIWLFGFHIAIALFFIVYLTFRARARWFMVLGLTVFVLLLLVYFDKFLEVFWPEGILEQWIKLPWLSR